MQRVLRAWPLVLLFVIALVPRAYQLDAYLPDSFHPDEDKEILRALKLAKGEYDLTRMHKGTLFVCLTGEYGALYAWMRATGQVGSTDDFIRTIVTDQTPLFYLSRLTVAIMGALTAVLGYLMARRLAGPLAGWLAGGLIIAFAPHLELSRFGRLDVPTCFAVFLVLYLALEALRSPTTLRLAACSAAAGLAVSTKTSAAPFLLAIVPPFLSWLKARPENSVRARRFGGAVLVSVATVAIFNFALLYHVCGGEVEIPATDSNAKMMSEQYDGGRPDLFDNYVRQPANQLGFPVLALAACGLAFSLGRRSWRPTLPVALWTTTAALQIALLVGFSDLVNWRYVMPAMLVVLVLAGIGARQLAQLAPRGVPRMASFGAIAAILIVPLAIDANGTLDHRLQEPTQISTRNWIEANIPSGEGLLLEGLDVFPSEYAPRLRRTHESMLAAIELKRVHDPAKASLLERYFLDPPEEPAYRLRLYRFSREIPTLAELRAEGTRYVVRRDIIVSADTDPESAYAINVGKLDAICTSEGVREIQVFEADGETRRGETLRIYDLGTGDSTDDATDE